MIVGYNEYNQPISFVLENYQPGDWPDVETIEGKTVRIEKLNLNHSPELYEIYGPNGDPKNFTYTYNSHFENYETFKNAIQKKMNNKSQYHFVIIDKATQKVSGTTSLVHIDTENRVIEVGSVIYSENLKRTRQATEAQFLIMKYVFETLKYRRYEWKCDHLNESSRRAATRLGFTFEGTFRQSVVYRNINRDIDWFSIIDKEWEDRKRRFQIWLSDDNFDENGLLKQCFRYIQ